MATQQTRRGIGPHFEDLSDWQDISQEDMQYYGPILAGRFGAPPRQRLDNFKIRSTRDYRELVSKDKSIWYVLFGMTGRQNIRNDFAFIKKEYASHGAFIRREFVFEDLGQAGFMWEAQR